MLKIKSRIAILYSILTVAFIIICIIAFYGIFKLYTIKEPVLNSITNKENSSHKDKLSPNEENSKASKNFVYTNAKDGGIKKSYIQISYSNENKNEIKFMNNSTNYSIKYDSNQEPTFYNNYIETIFSEKNKVARSSLLKDNFSEENFNENYGTENLKIYSSNKPKLYEILNKYSKYKLLLITDKDDNVIRLQVLTNDIYEKNMKSNVENNSTEVRMTAAQFENEIMQILYERAFNIIIIIIVIVILVNFILSKKYAVFALKPLIQFTNKVKEQSSLKHIKLIDIPDAKDEIYDLTCAYNSALNKVKKSYEDLQKLNSYASHELRNSLAVLRAKLEIGEDTREITRYIDKLTGVTNDILAMSTTEITNIEERVDLALVCAKVIDDYMEVFPGIILNIPEEGITLISGKELWLERCIANLIDNAIKYLDKNKINNEIIVNVYENLECINVEVYDNGVGIDEKKVEEIFKPYYGTGSRISTGIGLAYVKHIMNLHKGKIVVKSEKNKYSKFILIFYKEN